MAEAGLEWFPQPIISELVNKSISYLGSDIANIAEALQHLETILPKLQLAFQEPQHRHHEPKFVSWLARLKDAYFDTEAVLHDLESKRIKRKAKGENKKLLVRLSSKPIIKPLVNFLKKNSPMLSPTKGKLLLQLKKLKEVAAETNTFCELLGISNTESTDGIIADNRPPATCSLLNYEVFGRDGERDDIIEFLLDEQGFSSSRNSYSVVAVTGMGGAGKTTLAQYVYNDPRVKKHFGVRMWLHYFDNLDIIRCTKEMIEYASGKECPDLGNLDFLQNMLRETLCESDNIMVVLDDVWYDPEVVENDYWDILLKPFSRREGTCKIVVTSRSTLFPLILEPNKFIPLSEMPLDDFTSLLRYIAIGGLQCNDSQLKDDLSNILDQFAKKVSKLPLVAKVVGNQLCPWPDIRFWLDTLQDDNWSNTIESIQNTKSRQLPKSRPLTSSLLNHEVFGRDGERDDIIEFLLDEQGVSSSRNSYSVVAVTGMGGAGKTTLAQYVYNDPRVKKHFGVRMWLHLFENLDIIERTKEMIECASGKKCPDLGNLDFLQNMLRETLCESDNIMVVLDDVWCDPEVVENDYWDILLKPFSRREGTCKIVVTSHSTSFPSILKPAKLIHMSDMAPDDFRSLLRYHAIGGLQFNDSQLKDDLSNTLDQIAKKVSKLPLVAKVVGNQLRKQPDITFWLATLQNDNWSNTMKSIQNTKSRQLPKSRPLTSSLLNHEVFGRDGERDDIIEFLLDEQGVSSSRNSYSVVAVTGMGGAGKTTLAQYVYNDPRVKKHFGVRMWLHLFKNLDIIESTKEMIECASRKKCPDLGNLDFLQNMLRETLCESDNIMVVLDDVWCDPEVVENDYWDILLKPFSRREGTCKIVVTSHSTSFPSILQPAKLIHMSDMAPDDFRSLLRYHAIDSLGINDPQLENQLSDIVDEFAKKLSKSPLVAKIVGNQLRNQPDIMFWQATLQNDNLSYTMESIHHTESRQLTESRPLTSSLLAHEVFGRDGEREDIIKFLLDEQGVSSSRNSYSVVAVTGMGGAGKTTLTQYVYNDPRVHKHFGVKMWLHLSENLDIFERTKMMVECASGRVCPYPRNLYDLQNELIVTLWKSDNIMVVLDDVWYDPEVVENDYWDILLKPFVYREGTCKIVVTSRSTLFPSILQPDKLIHLSDMAPDDFTSLLRYHAIDSLGIKDPQLDNQLSDIVDQISKKLSKSPLVAVVVGNQLRNQPYITFWQATLKKVNLSNIMETLLWSFKRFDGKLQQCFLFCSVFPKGTRYNIDSLVPYWVALDFIGPSDENRNIEDICLEYFEKMVANYIFRPVDKTSKWYIMHDLFYDLAKQISLDCCRITNNEREIPLTVKHVYLQGNNENLQKNLSRVFNLENLHTLILENPFIDDISQIILKFSRNLRNLRVLELQSWGYKTLPTVVGNFRNLRLLSFWKSSIEELPDSLLQLNHLQYLQLPSSVKTLPTNFSKLIELRYIKMYNRYGREVFTLPPVSYLRNLTSLQVLHEFHVRKEKGYELHQLGPLNEIGGSLRIVNLENVSKLDEAVEARINDKHKLKKLELVWAQSTEINGLETEVIEALQPPPNLELLTIDGFRGSTYPTWLHKDSFIEYIKDVRFYNCNALTNLPPSFDQCSNCSELILQNLGALRELPTFPKNLASLSVINCGVLSKLPTFPEKLARLSIIKCPCLIFVCENDLQVNEKQSIMESPFLRRGVEGCKDIIDHELNSFKQIGLAESCTEQLKILETSELGDEPKQWVNVNGAWCHCHQQRMNFIFTQANKNELKLPSTLRVVHLGYCCVSDGALSGCLRGMSTLEELYIEGIMTLTTLPPAEVLMSLNSLRVLEIRHCWYLESLGDFHALPHLERCLILGYTPLAPTLQFKCCPPLPPTLKSFIVNNCCIRYKQ